MTVLHLQLDKNLYLCDPQETELGRNIINRSLAMIDYMGFERFKFKKHAKEINSTEPSIYRYFENKNRLLVYLIPWHWNWLEYKIDYSTQNITEPAIKLEVAIRTICEKKSKDPSFPQIDEEALSRIVLSESDKTYLTKHIDEDNKEGLFRGFKSLYKKIAGIIREINPAYPYPQSLVSTMLQASHQQVSFAQHLPSLTELKADDSDLFENNFQFLYAVVQESIKPQKRGKAK